MNIEYNDILNFWFRDLAPQEWFFGGDHIDVLVRERFERVTSDALKGKYQEWETIPRGRLALILVLDQFTRNIYRDTPQSYEGDEKAQILSLDGIKKGMDERLTFSERHFFYMPLMHAEDKHVQAMSVQKISDLKEYADTILDYAKGHCRIVEKFGRFPHRNSILGRQTTNEEEIFLGSKDNRFA